MQSFRPRSPPYPLFPAHIGRRGNCYYSSVVAYFSCQTSINQIEIDTVKKKTAAQPKEKARAVLYWLFVIFLSRTLPLNPIHANDHVHAQPEAAFRIGKAYR